jgi:hypothetical protein
MMNTEYLTHDALRQRMIDLSFSLYECLADLMLDANEWTQANDAERDELLHRIRLSAMNCTADIHLLIPIFKAVMSYGLESTR